MDERYLMDERGRLSPEVDPAQAQTPTLPGLAGLDDGWRPQKGDLFGRYVILQPIGRGGMGAVYAAYDPELDRKVAIKILLAGLTRDGPHSEAHHRLKREAKALARLNHPNVLTVFDVGEAEGRVFIATELIEGQDLRRWLAAEQSRRQVLRTFLAAGEGLAAAHREGVVHRDFKPGNVMIDNTGRVRVVDFGLAQVVADNRNQDTPAAPRTQIETQAASVGHGTPAYLAPEQHAGEPATAQSDQYSFCLALFEAFYGYLPDARQVEIPAVSPVGRVPAHLRRALQRGLAPAAEDRFDSMPALLLALGAHPWTKRWPALAVAATAAVSASIILLQSDEPTACRGGEGKLANVWTPTRRHAVVRTVGTDDTAFAPEAARAAVDAIDAYGAAWVAMHQATCLATLEHGEQSEAMLDLRMACLDRRLTELDALATLLAEPDAVPPERAVRAARGLVPLARCTDVRALRARQPLPTAPDIRARITELQGRLANAQAEYDAGRYRTGLAKAEAVVKDVSGIDYWPLKAESLLLWGNLQANTADVDQASDTLEQAFRAAVAGYDHRAAAEAVVRLVRVTGYQLADIARGQDFASHATAMLEQLSAPAELAGMLDDHVGTLFFQQGDYPRALEHHQRALASKRQVLGAEHPDVADTLTRLGNVATAQGQHSVALTYFEQAHATNRAALGPNHPRTAASLDRIGTARFNRADYDGAAAAHGRALEIRRAALGEKHPSIASTLMHLGNVAWARGHYADSLEQYGIARQIFEAALGAGHPNVALALTNEGNALLRLERFDEAIDHYQAARRIQTEIYGEIHTWVATTDLNLGEAWLEKGDARAALDRFRTARAIWEEMHDADHYAIGDALSNEGRALLALERPSEAVDVLERALAIRARTERDPTRLAITRFALARALGASGHLGDRAVSLAIEAQEELEQNPNKNRDRLAEVDAWLAAHEAPEASTGNDI